MWLEARSSLLQKSILNLLLTLYLRTLNKNFLKIGLDLQNLKTKVPKIILGALTPITEA